MKCKISRDVSTGVTDASGAGFISDLRKLLCYSYNVLVDSYNVTLKSSLL